MKKFFALSAAFVVGLFVVGLFAGSGSASASSGSGKILIAYFSRTGQEYGVGTVTKGNTAKVAEIIAEKTGGTLFEIRPVQSYPFDYKECTQVASREKAQKARPAIAEKVADFDKYDTIFVGYPIWWGDMPMPVYTFLESYNFKGKTIIPFCTHGGSGLSSTEQNITLTCPGAKLLSGFEMQGSIAQKEPAQAEEKISAWLNKIGF